MARTTLRDLVGSGFRPGIAALGAVLALAQPLAEGATPPAGPAGKIDSSLRALRQTDGRDRAAGLAFARTRAIHARGGPRGTEARVVIETAAQAELARGALEAAGARIVATADASASAWVPLASLEQVAALGGVLRVRRPVRPVWQVVSEGVGLTGADRAQGAGASGRDVRIGIIDAFQGYTARLGGELPPQDRVHFQSFGDGEGDSSHGVNVAEIVTDMAPQAILYLAAIDDDVGYRQAVDYLISQDVRVINHSGGFGLFGDMKGRGPIHEKVSQAAGAGIFYVESAGNEGRSHWEGDFRDQDGNGFAEFAPGVERIPFSAGAELELRVDMTWDDWKPSADDPRPTTDYDICLYNSAGEEVACADDEQSGRPGQVPFEVLSYTAPAAGQFSIGVKRASGASLHFEVSLMPNYDFGSLAVSTSSIIAPADHRDAFTVGATSLGDVIRGYSSRGPTNDGRTKPDLVAPDGVATSVSAFFGTSASAPHVSGAAALLIGLEPQLSREQVRDRLRSIAVRVPGDTTAGADNTYGYGRLNANVNNGAATPTPTPTPEPTPTPTPPPSGGGGGGGGCRLFLPGEPGAGLGLAVMLSLVLLYGSWLRRRG